MTDGGTPVQPGQDEAPPPVAVRVRPRSAFVAHEVFGQGTGAVLVEPEVARDLRTAAERASRQSRLAGGLLYGRLWADDDGQYLVVGGFLEARPGEDTIGLDGHDSFALTDADLRLLRADAGRTYATAGEAGWWRSLPGPGEFGPRDFESQRALAGPGGVGLLVFGSGLEWGTAYLGPGGEVPGSARSFIPVPRPAPGPSRLPPPAARTPPDPVPPDPGPPPGEHVPEDLTTVAEAAEEPVPEPQPVPEPGAVPEPGPDAELAQVTAGAPLAPGGPALTPAPQPAGPRVISPVAKPAREWGGAKLAAHGSVETGMPTDVKIVIAALMLTAILAAVLVGMLVSNMLVAVIAGLVLLAGLGGFLWMSRL